MVAVYISVLLFFLAGLGVIIFALSGVINFLKREPAASDWKKALVFLILAIIFFFMVGIVSLNQDVPEGPASEFEIEEEITEYREEVHHQHHHHNH